MNKRYADERRKSHRPPRASSWREQARACPAVAARRKRPAIDSPAIDSPAIDSPAIDSPAIDSPAIDTLGCPG
eukprot:scaffold11175_cov142-Isochrysis_galbana.AAC.3